MGHPLPGTLAEAPTQLGADQPPSLQLEAAKAIRDLLSGQTDVEEIIDQVVGTGVLPRLVELMSASSALQLDAVWSITNIAAGSSDHVGQLLESGALPPLIQLLGNSSDSAIC